MANLLSNTTRTKCCDALQLLDTLLLGTPLCGHDTISVLETFYASKYASNKAEAATLQGMDWWRQGPDVYQEAWITVMTGEFKTSEPWGVLTLELELSSLRCAQVWGAAEGRDFKPWMINHNQTCWWMSLTCHISPNYVSVSAAFTCV